MNKTLNTAGIKPFAIVMTIIILIAFLTSCQSKSGKLDKIQPEKVVVLDSHTRIAYNNGSQYYITDYKVKRITHGVTDWITVQGNVKYEYNDTIYHRFIK